MLARDPFQSNQPMTTAKLITTSRKLTRPPIDTGNFGAISLFLFASSVSLLLVQLALFPSGQGRVLALAVPRSSKSANAVTYYRFPQSRQFDQYYPNHLVDEQGCLQEPLPRVPHYDRPMNMTDIPVYIQNVPGAGSCLFDALGLLLAEKDDDDDSSAVNKTKSSLNLQSLSDVQTLNHQSMKLRQQSVDCLEEYIRTDQEFFLQGDESVSAQELLESVSARYGVSIEEYCQSMRDSATWGGGPEVIALCHVLERPIHMYQLVTLYNHNDDDKNTPSSSSFGLGRMAAFGSPKWDRDKALHVLSVDGRFPAIPPGEQQSTGNHFMALFPRRRPPPLLEDEARALEDERQRLQQEMLDRRSKLSRTKRWIGKVFTKLFRKAKKEDKG